MATPATEEISVDLLKWLFTKRAPTLTDPGGEAKTSGELVAEVTDGANLVEGKQTWEHANDRRHDINCMIKCCHAELRTMEKAGLVPAPYYFERVAILSRKARAFQQEVDYCTKYIAAVDEFYREHASRNCADVRKGPRYKAIVKRLPRAKELLAKQRAANETM